MKNLIVLIAAMVIIGSASSQTLPTFTGKTVVMRFSRIVSYNDNFVSIDDSSTSFYATINTEPLTLKHLKSGAGNGKIIASYIDRITTQGYKLITASTFNLSGNDAYNVVEYIFQKE